MIKANDLRIGNIVYGVNDRIETVVGLSQQVTYVFVGKTPETFREKLEDINPIPLTEEWLIKLGFELNPRPDQVGFQMYRHTKYNDFQIEQFNNKHYIVDGIDQWLTNSSEIWNVHHLQNLLYALFGEELI